jgi:hypothetical protein
VTDWWTQKIDLNTPAGETLRKLAEVLPKTRPFRITLFGSAPLQISIEPTLLSGGVDIFSDEEFLGEIIQRAGLSEPLHKPGF